MTITSRPGTLLGPCALRRAQPTFTKMQSPQDSVAERSKAVAQGVIPKGRGFEPHSCHVAAQSVRPPRVCVRAARATRTACMCRGGVGRAHASVVCARVLGMAGTNTRRVGAPHRGRAAGVAAQVCGTPHPPCTTSTWFLVGAHLLEPLHQDSLAERSKAVAQGAIP